MNQKFHNLFLKQEMETILEVATAYSDDVIVIHTEKYFFELSADLYNELDIYFDNQTTKEGRVLSKEEFLEKLENL